MSQLDASKTGWLSRSIPSQRRSIFLLAWLFTMKFGVEHFQWILQTSTYEFLERWTDWIAAGSPSHRRRGFRKTQLLRADRQAFNDSEILTILHGTLCNFVGATISNWRNCCHIGLFDRWLELPRGLGNSHQQLFGAIFVCDSACLGCARRKRPRCGSPWYWDLICFPWYLERDCSASPFRRSGEVGQACWWLVHPLQGGTFHCMSVPDEGAVEYMAALQRWCKHRGHCDDVRLWFSEVSPTYRIPFEMTIRTCYTVCTRS